MNLQETVQALEAKNITVAINLGQHQYCTIDSNCPIAVELRRLIGEAGVTLEELLEGYQAVTAPDPVSHDLPEIDGMTRITIAGKYIQLDLNDIVSDQVRNAMARKRRELAELQVSLQYLGRSLYQSYLEEIRRSRNTRTLPQLSFSRREIVETNCLITCDGDTYVFFFPVDYNPKYLVRGGTRYGMATRDVRAIKRQVFLEFCIRDRSFISTLLRDGGATKFQHYHGNRHNDCWGSVVLPARWDSTLRSLRLLANSIMNSLATINMDSTMMSEPPDMPHKDSLLERSTELGREGEFDQEVAATTTDTPRAVWGGRRR